MSFTQKRFGLYDLEGALLYSNFPANDLLDIFGSRGYRDAVLSIAARNGTWKMLAQAAMRSMSIRSQRVPYEIPYGELTALAIVEWRDNEGNYLAAAEALAIVDASDDRSLLLKDIIKCQNLGMSFERWQTGAAQTPVQHSIAFLETERRGDE